VVADLLAEARQELETIFVLARYRTQCSHDSLRRQLELPYSSAAVAFPVGRVKPAVEL
jgi:hypothetical protein